MTDDSPKLQEPRRWCGDGWTAQVLKNEDDDGWAVAMIKDGEPEPALVGPEHYRHGPVCARHGVAGH